MKELQTGGFYDFGAFRLDVKRHRLWRGEELIALTPKEFELLHILVENAGRVLEKDELHEKIWKDTFVEDGTLTRNISWLRKKLGAGSESSEGFIETLPKRGYRFLPEVTKSSDENVLVVEEQTVQRIRIEETISLSDNSLSDAATPRLGDAENRIVALPNVPASLWLAFGVLAIAVIGFAVYQNYSRKTEPKNIMASHVAPFSGLPGREDMPAFSPDGKQLAFAWNGGDGDNLNIYVKLIGTGEPLQLTNNASDDIYPTFSPDARQLAFVRIFPSHDDVFMVPSLGGAERKICSLASTGSSISFSPNGLTLAVVDSDSTNKHLAIFLVNLQNGERRRLTAPSELTGDNTPRFSPDGTRLAFLGFFGDFVQEIFVVSATGGDARQLTFDKTRIRSLSWSADGKKIIFVSFRSSNQSNLWQIPATGGEPDLIATGGKNIRNMAVSSNGKTVAFVEESEDANIWRIAAGVSPQKFIASTREDHSPNISPDGTRVVFASGRTGSDEIWISDADGKNQRQLTDSPNAAGSPRFSPDGQFIVYDAEIAGSSAVFIVSVEGGEPRRLTENDARNALPSWSADGKWIYFASNRGGDYQIWKMPAVGGQAVQITRQGGFESYASPDGKEIFYSKGRGGAGLWRVGAEGDEETPVAELAEAGYWRSWTVTRSGICYVARALNPPYRIKFYDFSNGQTKELTTVEKSPLWIFSGLSASADGKLILYAQYDQNASSIVLAELGK